MGFIYKITCSVTKKSYIGQTANKINERFTEHKKAANREKKRQIEEESGNETAKLQKRYNTGSRLLIDAMIEYGNNTFSIEKVGEFNDNELNEKEIFYIKEFDTQDPNGYNILKGGGVKDRENVKKAQSEIQSAKRAEDFNKYRVHNDILEGMPQYVISIKYGEDKGLAINNHPNCQRKNFMFKNYDDSVEKTKEALLDFYKTLNETAYVKPEKKSVKDSEKLPKGIRLLPKGAIAVEKTLYGQKIFKSFSGEGALQKAKDLLKDFEKKAEERKGSFIPKKTGKKTVLNIGPQEISKLETENIIDNLKSNDLKSNDLKSNDLKSTDSRFIIPKSNESKNKSSNIKKKGNNNSKFISLEELVKDVELPEEYDEIENVNHQAELGERRSENYPSAVEQVKKFLNLPKVEQERLSSGKSVRTDIKELFNPAPKEKPKLKRRTKKNDNNMNKNNNKIDLSEKKDEIDFDLNE
jgi:hypothetical protein